MPFGDELPTNALPLEGWLNGQGRKMHRRHGLTKQAYLMRGKQGMPHYLLVLFCDERKRRIEGTALTEQGDDDGLGSAVPKGSRMHIPDGGIVSRCFWANKHEE
jgi:hypothetical protein